MVKALIPVAFIMIFGLAGYLVALPEPVHVPQMRIMNHPRCFAPGVLDAGVLLCPDALPDMRSV